MHISVAMAVYNGENYLTEQLDSIREQTRAVDEVIICDDRSTDDSANIIRDYIDKYDLNAKWKLSINENNKGYASNFMEAVSKTSGDIIFFCDQDDIWVPDRVEKMTKIIEDNEEVLMLGSEFEPFSCSTDAPSIKKSVLKSFVNDQSLEHIKFSPKNVFIGSEGCTMCIRRSLYEQTKKYWFDGWAHDEYVWKMALCLDGCYIYHGTTLKRRMHSGNVSKRKMRNLTKRIHFLVMLQRSHEQTLQFAEEVRVQRGIRHLLKRNIKATELRIGLMQNKKLYNVIPLIFCYLNCYHSIKSIPVEFLMTIRGMDGKGTEKSK